VTQLLIATRNPGKQHEIHPLLANLPYDIVFPDDIGLHETSDEEHIESESTFEGNATRKAEYFSRLSGLPTVAEDSGIEVFALQGQPGVRSRRFAMAATNQDEANNAELLRRLAGAPPAKRGARYRCEVVLIPTRGGVPLTFSGMCRGSVLDAPVGTGGFGYDPLFYSEELGKSFGEASQEEKATVSHRARAFAGLVEWLRAHPL
jgi:XTP/dITP diphosphohydrolase